MLGLQSEMVSGAYYYANFLSFRVKMTIFEFFQKCQFLHLISRSSKILAKPYRGNIFPRLYIQLAFD